MAGSCFLFLFLIYMATLWLWLWSKSGGGLITKLCSTLATSWTVFHQVPLSMDFSRQEYWNGLSCPSAGDLPNQGIEPKSPASLMDSLPTELPELHLLIFKVIIIWWLFVSICFDSFSLIFGVTTISFFFVVTLRLA